MMDRLVSSESTTLETESMTGGNPAAMAAARKRAAMLAPFRIAPVTAGVR